MNEPWDRESFTQRMSEEQIDFRFWGKYGQKYVHELETALSFKFNARGLPSNL